MNEPELLPGEDVAAVGDKVRLIRNGHGLGWGTDAYLLAAYLRPARRACELGAGSGVISLLAAAHGKYDSVTAVEIRADMAKLARRNVALNGLEGKVTVMERDLRLLTHKVVADEMGGRFDVVFANPPYVAHPGMKNSDDAADAARHELCGGIGDFCAAAARLLNHGGRFCTVFRAERIPDLICALRENGLEPKRMTFVHPDRFSPPSFVLTESKLGGAPRLDVSAPLFFYADGKDVTPRVMSPEAAKIYSECSF